VTTLEFPKELEAEFQSIFSKDFDQLKAECKPEDFTALVKRMDAVLATPRRYQPHKQAEYNRSDLDCIHVQNGMIEVIRGDDDDHAA
jgi:hypothetical protein